MSTPTTLERSLRLTRRRPISRGKTTPVEDRAWTPQRVVCLTLRCTARVSMAVDQLPLRSVSHLVVFLPFLLVGPAPCSSYMPPVPVLLLFRSIATTTECLSFTTSTTGSWHFYRSLVDRCVSVALHLRRLLLSCFPALHQPRLVH